MNTSSKFHKSVGSVVTPITSSVGSVVTPITSVIVVLVSRTQYHGYIALSLMTLND